MSEIAGLPFWELHFDESGQMKQRVDPIPSHVTDFFVFAHCWNNDYNDAKDLYTTFFEMMAEVLLQHGAKAGVHIGLAGVFWPSIFWPDDEPPIEATGRAAFGAMEKDWTEELQKAYGSGEHAAISRMRKLIDSRATHPNAIAEFHQLLTSIAPASSTPEDEGERSLLDEEPSVVFEALADLVRANPARGAAFPSSISRLWMGAKEAARITSYWKVKERAGVVGERGLGPYIRTLPTGLRVHLIGHSFGARLVSFSLRAAPRNVKSLFLLQGAFSHYSFADSLPHDTSKAGSLSGMARRVDGPILVTHSKLDSAMCERYPITSWIMRRGQTAITVDPKWMALGADGAQAVDALSDTLRQVGHAYRLEKGKFLNLNSSHVIKKGGWPSGAHSDIVHPEIAWAALAASGVA